MPWSFRRQRILINRSFQLQFVAYSVGIAYLVAAVFYAAIRYFFWRLGQQGRAIGLPENHVFFRFLDEQRSVMDLLFVVTALASFVILGLFGLYLSHRVAGPVHKLTTALRRRASTGSFKPIRFRAGDYFHELANAANDALQARENQEKKGPVE